MRGLLTSIRPLRRDEGFTMVEVLIAIFLLSVGILATFQVLQTSMRTAMAAKRNQVAVAKAQREMEALKRLDWKNLALNATPSTSTDTTDPLNRVSGTTFDVDRTTATDAATMAIDATNGTVAPGPESFTSGDISGKVYRFIVWRNEAGCGANCPGTNDYKRIVVIVKLDSTALVGQTSRYIEIQSFQVDPHDGTTNASTPTNYNQGTPTTAQQFWLYDTPCTSTTRQTIVDNHQVHDTPFPADCSGTGARADLMSNVAPPDPAPSDAADPLLYDYGTNAGGGSNGGLAIKENGGTSTTPGCSSTSGSPEEQEHIWVANKPSSSFILSGRASLVAYTKTKQGTAASARMCAKLYKRSYVDILGVTTVVDTLIQTAYYPTNSGSSYPLAAWPTAWSPVTISFPSFSSLTTAQRTILTTDRLMLNVFVPEGASTNRVIVAYDHPDYQSRLEVETSTPF